MMCASFNGNICTTVTNVSDKTDITAFYNELSSLVWHIHKHILIIGGDVNIQIGKDRHNNVCLHNSPNRNGEYLADFSLEAGCRK